MVMSAGPSAVRCHSVNATQYFFIKKMMKPIIIGLSERPIPFQQIPNGKSDLLACLRHMRRRARPPTLVFTWDSSQQDTVIYTWAALGARRNFSWEVKTICKPSFFPIFLSLLMCLLGERHYIGFYESLTLIPLKHVVRGSGG